jgi:uncharacterized radical SAM protein YgiQ
VIEIIPTTAEELQQLGWQQPDVVILSGDAFVDHPSFGAAVIARVLLNAGYKTAVADSIDMGAEEYIKSLGKPRYFYGVTSGNVDSMVSRYTAFKKVRNDDPYRVNGKIGNRPKRALIYYCNMIKSLYKDVPIVLGGLEASMRRHVHYDYMDNALRRSILFDTRADILIYGMGEKAVVEAAHRIRKGETLSGIAGTVVVEKEPLKTENIELPTEEEVFENKLKYAEMFKLAYLHNESVLTQKSAKRYLVQYPLEKLTTKELDSFYSLPYTRLPHPKYKAAEIPAFVMIQHSITSHRGCISGCSFCSISLHQGREIISRSEESIQKETEIISRCGTFKGHITDVGGPSANMYGTRCVKTTVCRRESCLFPNLCKNLRVDTKRYVKLLRLVENVTGVTKVSLGSGIRYDLLMADDPDALDGLVKNHISGQLKIAPEHTEVEVLHAMRKFPLYSLDKLLEQFKKSLQKYKKKYFLIPYLMSNHPGSRKNSMKKMKREILSLFGFVPKQVQSFYPLPMTLSSVMYYTGIDPITGKKIYTETEMKDKRKQHEIFFKGHNEREKIDRKKRYYT